MRFIIHPSLYYTGIVLSKGNCVLFYAECRGRHFPQDCASAGRRGRRPLQGLCGGGKILHCVQNDRLFVGDGACDIPQAGFVQTAGKILRLCLRITGSFKPPLCKGRCPTGGGIVTYQMRRRHLTSSLFSFTYYFLMRDAEGVVPYGIERMTGNPM